MEGTTKQRIEAERYRARQIASTARNPSTAVQDNRDQFLRILSHPFTVVLAHRPRGHDPGRRPHRPTQRAT